MKAVEDLSHPGPGAARPCVLTVAGLDSSAGAGITADVAAITALGPDALVACTAVTVQTPAGVVRSHALPEDLVVAQIEAAFDAFPVRAVKTGMLACGAIVHAVATALRARRERGADFRLVVDPVIAASAGGELLSGEGVTSLIADLLPLADVCTPNLAEAARLSGAPVSDIGSMREAARRIRAAGARAVIVTGGHLEGDPVDVAYDGQTFHELRGRRAPGTVHGTGCTYSASLAAYLAKGIPLLKAAAGAKQMATIRIEEAG